MIFIFKQKKKKKNARVLTQRSYLEFTSIP